MPMKLREQLLCRGKNELDPTLRKLIRQAKSRADWDHLIMVATNFNLATPFEIGILKAVKDQEHEAGACPV